MSIRKREWISKTGLKVAWVVDYRDQHGKRRLKTFSKKKDADAWWQATAAPEIHAGTHTADSASVTVAEAADAWIEYVELEGRERSTIAQYRQHIDLHIVPRIGTEKLSRLTTPRIQSFRDELLKDISRPLAKKVLTSVKSMLGDAMRRGTVAQNVARPVKIQMDRRNKQKLRVGIDIPSRAEIQALLSRATGRWRPVLVTAIFTGMRASELRGLTWANVDFEGKVIHVRQRADRYKSIGAPKSEAGERSIPMTPMVFNTLRDWQSVCPRPIIGRDDDNKAIRAEPQPEHLVFPNGSGNVEELANLYRRGLGDTQVRAGVVVPTGEKDDNGNPVVASKYGLHALRHFYASWCINRRQDGGLELPAKTVQERLGHNSITMKFDRYGHLFPAAGDDFEDMRRAEDALLSA